MILSDTSILKHCLKHDLVEGYDDDCLNPASLDLRMGDTALWMDEAGEWSSTNGEFTILPDDFALVSTMENVNVPTWLCGFVWGKSSLARLGLQVHTAGLIDPGFSGKITLELSTVRPVHLVPGQRICQVVFHELDLECGYAYDVASGHYQYQDKPTRSYLAA